MSDVGMTSMREENSRLVARSVRACLPLLALSLCLAFAILALTSQVVGAQGTITRCEPEWIWVPNNQQATICIYVQDVVGLYGVDFEMTFPDMVGIATVVDEDPIFTPGFQILPNSTFMSPPWMLTFDEADNTSGYLHYLVHEVNPSEPKTGSGPIACMRFQPDGGLVEGYFNLTFSRHDLSTRDGFLISNTAHTCMVGFYQPTAVDLLAFEAWPEGRGIHLQWETANEVDNVGFNLYRSKELDGKRTRLNDQLIPSQTYPGSPFGAVYDYVDEDARDGRAYFYWLEDVDIYGHGTIHGPVVGTRDKRRL
jgi:hypothetical protein